MSPLRIGLVVENAAPFVFEEVASLRALDLEVEVASVFRPAPAWEAEFGSPVHYPARGAASWLRQVLPSGLRHPRRASALAARAASEGAPLRLVALALAWGARARREGWQHLHASFAGFPAFVAAEAARIAGIPWSFTAHAYDVQEPRPWLPRLLREACFVRAISRESARRLRHLAPEAGARIRVGHLGVDERRFAPPALPPPGPPRIVAVASPGPTKGLDVLVEAVGRLVEEGSPVRLEIWGEGPLRAELVEQIAARGLAERVLCAGAADREQVAAALRRATLFALPCVTLPRPPAGRHDGLPVAILEAMATGLPVVSTPVGGIPEALEHGNTGWLVPERDADALAVALRRLLGEPRLRARLGLAARAEVLARFRASQAAARLAGWLREAGPDAASAPVAVPAEEVTA